MWRIRSDYTAVVSFFMGKSTNIKLPGIMAPAGSEIYCTISDWAKFITDQLRGTEKKDGLLKAVTYKKLQTRHLILQKKKILTKH